MTTGDRRRRRIHVMKHLVSWMVAASALKEGQRSTVHAKKAANPWKQ